MLLEDIRYNAYLKEQCIFAMTLGILYTQDEQRLDALPTDSPRQLNIIGHDSNPLGVDCAQISILKEAN